MTFYILIFLICFIGFILNNYLIKDKKKRIIIDILLMVMLCLISGLRGSIGGYDYRAYHKVFDGMPTLNNFDFQTIHLNEYAYNLEKGFLFYVSFIKTLGINFYGFIFITSLIFYLLLYFGIRKYTKNFTLFILFFLYKIFFWQTFVILRQAFCMVAFIYMIDMIKKGQIVRYMILTLLLMNIHVSSLIFIPIYFLKYLKISKKTLKILLIIFLPTLLLSIFNISILDLLNYITNILPTSIVKTRLLEILSRDNSVSLSLFNTIEYYLLMFFVVIKYDDLKKKENFKIILNILLVLLPLFTIFRDFGVFGRFKDYFVIYYIVMIDMILDTKINLYNVIDKVNIFNIRIINNFNNFLNKNIFKKIDNKKIIYGILILYFLVTYIRNIKTMDNGSLIPYKPFWM